MNYSLRWVSFLLALLVLPSLASYAYLEESLGPSYSDFGGVGLLQMPSGRMAEEGTFGFAINRTSPYSRYSIMMQPFPWMEATVRYISISGMAYGESISDQSYQDKSIDVKFRLLKESKWLPEVSVGLRDMAGTSFFSSEYLAASKRFGPLDLTLGVGWGYLAGRAHADNPFGFGERHEVNASDQFKDNNYFRGSIAYFGGLEYQTPWRRLRLKMEYDGNDYENEPDGKTYEVSSPINYGLVYRITKNMDLVLGYERGTTVMGGLTWSMNLKKLKGISKTDITPAPIINQKYLSDNQAVDWKKLVGQLKSVGMSVTKIEAGKNEVSVFYDQKKVHLQAEQVGLASRLLANALPKKILVFNFIEMTRGMAINEISLRRDQFVAAATGWGEPEAVESTTEYMETYAKYDYVTYREEPDRFNWAIEPDLKMNFGGPDAPILYQARVNLDASFNFTPGFDISTSLSARLADNYDKYEYDGPSTDGVYLPRVRTHVRDYLKGSKAWINNLQLTYTRRLSRDWYGMVYGGLLESMYGGGGAELLYRPINSNFALGLDINYVRQRGFERRFDFRDYEVPTGHLTAYYNWRRAGVVVKASVGQYLAEDRGATLDIARRFKNGVMAGLYATKTNVSAEEFGEGSFDKGVYVQIPLDYLVPWHSKSKARFVWAPLIRDGGAKLSRKFNLYDMTEHRNSNMFYDNIDKIVGPVSVAQKPNATQ
jgi:hypothetical protein